MNSSETPLTPTRAKVDQCIAKAVEPHQWLADWINYGIEPDLDRIGAAGAINALFSTLGGAINALDLLAAEIDRQDASR